MSGENTPGAAAPLPAASFDAALDARLEQIAPDPGDGGEPAPAPDPEPEELPDAATADDPEAGDHDGPEAEGDEPEAHDDEPDGEQSTAGTKDNPYTLDDLSGEVFFKVKVDGEEHVVSEKDLGKSFVFQREGQARLERANKAIQEAEQIARQGHESTQRIRQGFFNTLQDPQALLNVLESDFPDTLDAIAISHYPKLETAYSEGRLEQFRESRQLAREKRLLAAHREKAQRQSEAQRVAQMRERKLTTFRPALEAALKETGFNKITPDLAKDIGVAADTFERRTGREPTTAEITQLAVKWLRANGPAPSNGNGKPRKPRHRNRAPQATQAKRSERTNREVTKFDDFGEISTEHIMRKAGLI